MEFLKTVTGRVVTGLAAVGGDRRGGFPGGRWIRPPVRTRWFRGMGRILAWFGIMLVWPWASFAIIARVAKLESNLAGVVARWSLYHRRDGSAGLAVSLAYAQCDGLDVFPRRARGRGI